MGDHRGGQGGKSRKEVREEAHTARGHEGSDSAVGQRPGLTAAVETGLRAGLGGCNGGGGPGWALQAAGEKHPLERWGRRCQLGQGRLRGVWLGGHRPGHWVQRLGREWPWAGPL